jgi:hypothetical protein
LLDLRADIGVVVLTNAQDADANGMAQEVLRIVRGAVSIGRRNPSVEA